MLLARKLIGLFTALAVFVAVVTGASAKNYALVVGVNNCPKFKLALNGAENDADAMQRLLVGRFEFPKANVCLLKGKAATNDALRKQFQWYKDNLAREDQFVFHFSGHGSRSGEHEALCPSDVTENGENRIMGNELAKWLDDLPARRVAVILDCCYSGTGFKDINGNVQVRSLRFTNTSQPERVAKLPWQELRALTKDFDHNFVAMFACGSDQPAYELKFDGLAPPLQNGAMGQFTRYLIEGLDKRQGKDRHGDKATSVAKLTDYVKHRIDESFNKDKNDSEKQVPAFEAGRPDLPLIELTK